MSESALVHQLSSRQGSHQGVAEGLQRRKTEVESCGGLTPSAYAEQLAEKHDKFTSDSKLGRY